MPSFSLEVPRQPNGTDCGLFVLQYIESFFQVRKTDRQKDGKTEGQLEKIDRQLDYYTAKPTDAKTERQKDRKTERQKDRKTERQKDRKTV